MPDQINADGPGWLYDDQAAGAELTGPACQEIAPTGSEVPICGYGSAGAPQTLDGAPDDSEPAEFVEADDDGDDEADEVTASGLGANEPELGELEPAEDDPREAAEGAIIDPAEPAAEALPDDPFGPEYTTTAHRHE